MEISIEIELHKYMLDSVYENTVQSSKESIQVIH